MKPTIKALQARIKELEYELDVTRLGNEHKDGEIINQAKQADDWRKKYDGLSIEHKAYGDKINKMMKEQDDKHKVELKELKDALNEIMPVLKRLLDWRIKNPLA